MSTTGDLEHGQATPEAMEVILAPPPEGRAEAIAMAPSYGVWASKRYFDPARACQLAAAAYDRSSYPEGASRRSRRSTPAAIARSRLPTSRFRCS